MWSCLGEVGLGLYILFETWIIVGQDAHQLNNQDYIYASLLIYIDGVFFIPNLWKISKNK